MGLREITSRNQHSEEPDFARLKRVHIFPKAWSSPAST